MTAFRGLSIPLLVLGFGCGSAFAASSEQEASTGQTESGVDQADAENVKDAGDEGDRVFPAEIEKLLTEPSEMDDYTVMERCLTLRSIRRTRILDDQHIVFEMPSDKLFLVRFKHRCMQLRRDSTLLFDVRGSRVCQLDTIRASNSFGVGSVGPPCSIPGFVSVSSGQVALLKESLKAKRKPGSTPKPSEETPEKPSDEPG